MGSLALRDSSDWKSAFAGNTSPGDKRYLFQGTIVVAKMKVKGRRDSKGRKSKMAPKLPFKLGLSLVQKQLPFPLPLRTLPGSSLCDRYMQQRESESDTAGPGVGRWGWEGSR